MIFRMFITSSHEKICDLSARRITKYTRTSCRFSACKRSPRAINQSHFFLERGSQPFGGLQEIDGWARRQPLRPEPGDH